MQFQLKLSDYLALVGLAFGTLTIGHLITDKAIESQVNLLAGKIEVATVELRAENATLERSFQAMSTDIVTTVNEGLSRRTDEVMLALASFGGFIDSFTVHVSNLPIEGPTYESLEAFSANMGAKTSVYKLDQVAYYKIELSDMHSGNALALQGFMENMTPSELENVRVQVELGPIKTDPLRSSKVAANVKSRIRALDKLLYEYDQ